MVDQSVLTAPSVSSADEVVSRLTAIEQALPATDGLGAFNRMYLLVTNAIEANLGTTTFGDPTWLTHLDVVFANLYLDAVRDSVVSPESVPRAWAPLLELRDQSGIVPLQFAFAGMNAHINRDLSLAVVDTCNDMQTSPDVGSHHADFLKVNVVLAEVEPTIRQEVEGTLLSDADGALPGLQDLLANFNMVKARETAWTNAVALWTLAQLAPDRGASYLDALDRLTGFAGRSLLVRLQP